MACLLAAASVSAGERAFTLGEMQVVSTFPDRNRVGVRWVTFVRVTFDRPVQTATVNSASFRVHGRWSGRADGILSFSNDNRTVTLDPNRAFSAGETVYVNLGHSIVAADGSPLRSAGYAFQFTVLTRSRAETPPGPLPFTQIDSLVVRSTPNVTTRAYGGLGSDFDRDGWLDLAVVNEDGGDLRVFKNRGEGNGLYDAFLQPPTPIGHVASPNEPGDFNNDGFPDAVTGNTARSSRATGTARSPRPAVVTPGGSIVASDLGDLDGDGDLDWVLSSFGSARWFVYRNNGAGVMTSVQSFVAPQAASCSVFLDFDNDRDLDLALVDENADVVLLMRNNTNNP